MDQLEQLSTDTMREYLLTAFRMRMQREPEPADGKERVQREFVRNMFAHHVDYMLTLAAEHPILFFEETEGDDAAALEPVAYAEGWGRYPDYVRTRPDAKDYDVTKAEADAKSWAEYFDSLGFVLARRVKRT